MILLFIVLYCSAFCDIGSYFYRSRTVHAFTCHLYDTGVKKLKINKQKVRDIDYTNFSLYRLHICFKLRKYEVVSFCL